MKVYLPLEGWYVAHDGVQTSQHRLREGQLAQPRHDFGGVGAYRTAG